MRKIVWALLLLGAYFWVVSTGREEMILKQGKALYKAAAAWLESADIDYHFTKEPLKKKRGGW